MISDSLRKPSGDGNGSGNAVFPGQRHSFDHRKTVIKHFPVVKPIVRIVQSDRNKHHTVPLRGCDKTSAAFLREPRLYAYRAVVGFQKAVVIDKKTRASAVLHRYHRTVGRYDPPERFVLHRKRGEHGKIARRRIVILGVKPVRILKRRAGKPQLLRSPVHQHGKIPDRPGDTDRNGCRGIVRALKHHGKDKLLHRQLLVPVEIYRRALNSDRLFRNRDGLFQVAPLNGNERGHYLRGACHRPLGIGVLFKNDPPASRIKQQSRRRGNGRHTLRPDSRGSRKHYPRHKHGGKSFYQLFRCFHIQSSGFFFGNSI